MWQHTWRAGLGDMNAMKASAQQSPKTNAKRNPEAIADCNYAQPQTPSPKRKPKLELNTLWTSQKAAHTF